jgi:hypothetical protein
MSMKKLLRDAKEVGGTGRVEFRKLGFVWQLEDRKVMELLNDQRVCCAFISENEKGGSGDFRRGIYMIFKRVSPSWSASCGAVSAPCDLQSDRMLCKKLTRVIFGCLDREIEDKNRIAVPF